jgi:hypothetical protein
VPETTNDWIQVAFFSGPTAVLPVVAFVAPILPNHYILEVIARWRASQEVTAKNCHLNRDIVDVNTFIDKVKELEQQIELVQGETNLTMSRKKPRVAQQPE